MSKIHIEEYKGQTIEYDIDYDKFVCDISIEDKFKKAKRGSLVDMRKEIDTFIKLNLEFKPFKVLSYDWGSFGVKVVESVRTDGSFVLRKPEGGSADHVPPSKMDKYSVYDHDLWLAYSESQSKMDEICKAERSRHDKVFRDIKEKLVPVDVSKYAL